MYQIYEVEKAKYKITMNYVSMSELEWANYITKRELEDLLVRGCDESVSAMFLFLNC